MVKAFLIHKIFRVLKAQKFRAILQYISSIKQDNNHHQNTDSLDSLSHHPSLSATTLGKSSRWHPVSTQS